MDATATIPPHGSTDTLYVRFYHDFGFGSERLWGGYANPSEMMFVFTPTMEAPTGTYQIRAFRNFLSDESTAPFRKGEVYKITNVLGPIDVSDIKTTFLLTE
jgi:hypothetical protein